MPLRMEVGLGPGHIVLDGDPAPPPTHTKGGHTPILWPCLLWPNGWMDQDATCYGCRPQLRPHCIRWGPSPPKGHSSSPPNFWPMYIVATQLHGSGYHLVLIRR